MQEFQTNFNHQPILPPYSYKHDNVGLPVLKNLTDRRNAYSDTVARETQAYTLEDPELQVVVAESLALEQIDALDALQKAYEQVPIDDLVQAHATATLLATELRSKTINDLVSTETFTQLDQLAEKATSLAPNARAKILEIVEGRKVNLIDDALRSTVIEHGFVEAELGRATARIMQAYEGWPVSQATRLTRVLATVALDPQSKDPNQEITEDVEIVHEEIYETEEQVADILSLFLDEQIKIDELVHFFEDHDEFDTDEARRRKQVIDIFRGESGSRITELLYQKGIVLVHGWSLTSGSSGAGRERLLRTVPINAITEIQEVVTTKDSGISTATVWGIDIENDLQDEIEHHPVVLPKELAAESRQKNREKDWESKIKVAIGEAIARLEDMSLLTADESVSRSKLIVARQGANRIFGTETNVKRLVAAKLLPRKALETQVYEFTPSELVLMMMFNTSRDMLEHPAHKKEAHGLIDNILSSYFKRKEERQAQQSH